MDAFVSATDAEGKGVVATDSTIEPGALPRRGPRYSFAHGSDLYRAGVESSVSKPDLKRVE